MSKEREVLPSGVRQQFAVVSTHTLIFALNHSLHFFLLRRIKVFQEPVYLLLHL